MPLKGSQEAGDGPKNEKRYVMSPTAEAFHQNPAFVRAVMGPVGGGKTSMCCMELFFASLRQAPDPDTGIRSVRWGVTRATYNEIEHALLPTFIEWVGHFNPHGWKRTKPMSWNAKIPLNDGTLLDLEVIFISVGIRESAAEKFRGLELTGLFVSEYSTLSVENFDIMVGRVGRWPKRRKDGEGNVIVECTEPCVIMESNPPSRDSSWYHMFERSAKSADRQIFHQPSAVTRLPDGTWIPNPRADNFTNHSGGGDRYYRQQLATMGSDEKIKVYLGGEYGRALIGNPVWPMFQSQKHLATPAMLKGKQKLDVAPQLPVFAGMDFGLNSALVLGQVQASGQLWITDAIWRKNLNTQSFITSVMVPLLEERYTFNWPTVYGDPTGVNREGNTSTTAFSLLRDHGITGLPAPTNAVVPRVGAVADYLEKDNAIVFSPHVVDLLDAMSGGYSMVESANGHGVARPTKGDPSHIANALEYLCVSLVAKNTHAANLQKQNDAAMMRRSTRRRSVNLSGTM